MTYDWKKFLTFAEMLYKENFWQDDVDTKYRIIISRAYYAAFHCTQKFLQDNHWQIQRASGEHEKVIKSLKEIKKKNTDFQRKCKKLGLNLERLKWRRVQADYRDDSNFSDGDVKKYLNVSRNIIETLDKLRAEFNCK